MRWPRPTSSPAGARFVCDSAGERLLHPSMLASLVYRFGPTDAAAAPAAARLVINGQCTAVRREQLLAAGGYRARRGHMTDDAAERAGARPRGWRVAFRDGGGLLEVKMHDSAARGVARVGPLARATRTSTGAAWQAADLAVVWLAMALPVSCALAAGRGRPVDLALLAVRCALLARPRAAATRAAGRRSGSPRWPTRDRGAPHGVGPAPGAGWRGRTYGP